MGCAKRKWCTEKFGVAMLQSPPPPLFATDYIIRIRYSYYIRDAEIAKSNSMLLFKKDNSNVYNRLIELTLLIESIDRRKRKNGIIVISCNFLVKDLMTPHFPP